MPTHEFGPGFREGIERGFDGGFHWFGIVPLVMFALLIGVIVWAVIRLTHEGGVRAIGGSAPAMIAATAPVRPDAALDELRLRYARGEMTREDYADRLHDLSVRVGGTTAPKPSTHEGSERTPPDGA